jgi:parallel beta-helix repeat protein
MRRTRIFRARSLFTVALATCVALGCDEDDPGEPMTIAGQDGGAAPDAGEGPCAPGCDLCVEAGEAGDDDQAAVQTAFVEVQTGQTVCLGEGTFSLTTQLDLAADGIVVRGAGKEQTRLDFGRQELGGNAIAVTGDDTTLEAFTIWQAGGDGIRATDVEGFTVRDVAVLWEEAIETNPGYGIYPVGSTGVLIERCEVCCASDTGIYVGQSSRIVVRDNEVYQNVAGIEIENSTDSEVSGNHAHDNSAGILTFNLPELPVQGGARCKIHDNVIENNDHENFAAAGNIVASVPAGTGILVLATDDNEIHGNQIRGNDTAGVLIISYIEALLGAYHDPAYDPFPERNWVHDNVFADNGGSPRDVIMEVFPDVLPGPDVGWDGCLPAGDTVADETQANCVSANGDARYLNVNVIFCGASGIPDPALGSAECEGTPLPEIDL